MFYNTGPVQSDSGSCCGSAVVFENQSIFKIQGLNPNPGNKDYLDRLSLDLHAVPDLLPDSLANLFSGQLPRLQLIPEVILLGQK